MEKNDCRSWHGRLTIGNFLAVKHGQDAHATWHGHLVHATWHGHLARVSECQSKKDAEAYARAVFHPQGPAAEAFVQDNDAKNPAGPNQISDSLAPQPSHTPWTGRRSLAVICNYFSKNRGRMRYHEYLRQGYPIASGVIEGACRHVVKDRLERTGMSWTPSGAQAVLHLRAIATSDQWNDFLTYRVEDETQRLYPYRQQLPPLELAISA